MNRSSATINILESEKWRQFLESTAASLQINLVYLGGAHELFSVNSICPACGRMLPALDILNESNGAGTAASDGKKSQEMIELDEKHAVAVRGFSCCQSCSALSFREKVNAARKLLTTFHNILFCPLHEVQPASELTALHQISRIVLSMIRGQGNALERAFELILSAAIIMFDAGGSWFEYTAAGKRHLMTKGIINPALENSPLSICDTVAVDIHSPEINGILGIISPVDREKAVEFLDYLMNECIVIFEIDKLMKLLEARLTVLLNAVDNLVLVADGKKYICYANKTAAQLLNRPIHELIGLPASGIDAPWSQCILAGTGKITRGVKDLLPRGSDDVFVDWEVFPLAQSCDMPGWLIVARDRTDYYRLQELAEKTENLVHASALLSAVAHEIRNPMATFNGLLQIIELKGGTPEISKYVGIGMNEIRKITLLLDEFSQMGKTAEAALEKTDAKAFMEEVFNLAVTGFNGPDIEITTSFGAVAPVMADRRLLTQAIISLIKNAFEALNRRGKIALFLSQHDEDWVEIRICDNGPGISNHMKDKLFKPYFSTKTNGAGLGLAIVRSIISKHNGRITAHNLPDGGACFSILLPSSRQ